MAKSGFAKEALKSYVDRLLKIDEEREALADDRKEIKSEAKGAGFDGKTLETVVKRARMDKADRMEADAMLDLYESALGMR